ncbi:PREDICTED: transmembrane protein 179B-like, partial [Thamnophis sirtalis]|uniref:Transmembrane protein 179B-like n=1 Tax=Thamnophis sirtalis TaxID=35019 RepID=A0A6I9Y8K1_9SAUR
QRPVVAHRPVENALAAKAPLGEAEGGGAAEGGEQGGGVERQLQQQPAGRARHLRVAIPLRGLYSLCYGDGHLVHAWIRTSLVVSATLLFFLLVSACVLRVGMDVFCSSIQRSKAAASCQEAQQHPWVKPYRPGKFYDNLYAAQATAWVNFFFWFLMSFLLFVECIRKAPYQPVEDRNPQPNLTVPATGDPSP